MCKDVTVKWKPRVRIESGGSACVAVWLIVAQMQHLGEEGSCDEDLYAGGNEKLDDEKYNARWTLFCDTAETIANGRLRFQGEQESSR